MISDTKARKAKPKDKPYRIADHGGLALEVRPTGAKIWRYRYRLHGKAGMFTVGPYPEIGLAAARSKLEWARSMVAQGKHPREVLEKERQERGQQLANSFRAISDEWLEYQKDSWAPSTYKWAKETLTRDLWRRFGKKPITEISSQDILLLLRDIEGRGSPASARMAKKVLGQVFRYAIINLKADYDPTQPLRGALKPYQTRHKPALSVSELGEMVRMMWSPFDDLKGGETTIRAARFLALTFVRQHELRPAEWEEFDLEGDHPTWTIPRERMKNRKAPHVVPLSKQAVEVLLESHREQGHQRYAFPARYAGLTNPMHKSTINHFFKRNGFEGFTGHAFRTTASTILNSYGWDSDWIERQLAHVSGDAVRAAYNHAKYLPQRREMMQWWGDLIETLTRSDGEAPAPVPGLPGVSRQATDPRPPAANGHPTQP